MRPTSVLDPPRRPADTADLAFRRSSEMRTLLELHPDLRGVHEFADLLGERISWCA